MQNKKARHRYKPASKPPAMVLTERDKDILAALYNYRVLTTPQIQKLLFPSKPGGKEYTKLISCRRRLHKLYHNQFVGRLRVPVLSGTGTRPMVYALNRLGAEMVAKTLDDAEGLDWKPKDSKISPIVLDHLLDINEFRVAVETATRSTSLVLHEWLDERELKRCQKGVKAPHMTLKKIPDGYFTIHNTKKNTQARFFLELDRGTESGRSKIAGKIRAYQNYYLSGQYTHDFGAKSLRVLFVLNSENRLRNLLNNVAAEVDKNRLMWFATMEAAKNRNPLTNEIWHNKPNQAGQSLLGRQKP